MVADLDADIEVVLAARERQDAVRALAALSANGHKEIDNTRVRLELKKKIAQLTEKHTGAVDAVGPGGVTPLLVVCLKGRVGGVTVTACSRCRPW